MNNIVLIGAVSTNFGSGTIGYFFKSNILADSTIVLHDINTEALKKSKAITRKALLTNPLVDNAIATEKMLDNIIEIQKQHLGCLI